MNESYIEYLNKKEGHEVMLILARVPHPQQAGAMAIISEEGIFLKAFDGGIAIRSNQRGEQFWRWDHFQTLCFPSKVELAGSIRSIGKQ